ncbi:PleD family two-component system response regulator [Chloroflexota bacterium]
MQERAQKTNTILVIEDDLDMLQLFRRILEPEGYLVMLADNGIYGMTLLKEVKPDLVLLDIIMPGPDGYVTLESIRQYSNVPVIMVTAKRETEALRKAADLGADDYIKKPFRPAELLVRVKTKLKRFGAEAERK